MVYANLSRPLFARVAFHSSLYQLGPQVQARMYSHRLQCIRNGIKKITLDLDQLKATLKKKKKKKKNSFCILKERYSPLASLTLQSPFCFLLRMAYIFFNDCLLVGKKTRPSRTHTRTVIMFYLEKEETKLI